MNFDGYCNKIESILNLWKSRGLTLIGKINIVKCLILPLPKLLYKLSVLPTDVYPPFLKFFDKISYGFIWGSRWERISRINVAGSIESGGVKMIYLPYFIVY